MAFRIAPFPGQTYPPRYAQHADIRAYLGLGKLVQREIAVGFGQAPQHYMALEAGKLPLDYSNPGVQATTTEGRLVLIWCLPGNPSPNGMRGKSSTHRCFARCPDCHAAVPAGRTHQHKCKLGGAK